MKTIEVKKYIKQAPKWLHQTSNKYMLEIGGLMVFFETLKEAEEYYLAYLK